MLRAARAYPQKLRFIHIGSSAIVYDYALKMRTISQDASSREITKMPTISTIEELETIYDKPLETSIAKEVHHITSHYRALIEASPFAVLATAAPEGLDCSPRGDQRGFVRVVDDRTLMMPDRRGNNRIDSLRNIVRDGRVALLFMIPGSGTTLRVNGRAHLTTDTDLLASFAMEGHLPRSVIVIAVESIYFQCARAIMRSELWNPERHADPRTLPTAGQMLAQISDNRIGGEKYDREWPERAKKSLW
jgi:PPOX class probable FMN-dependent enzyme